MRELLGDELNEWKFVSDEYNLYKVAVGCDDGCVCVDSWCVREVTAAPLIF